MKGDLRQWAKEKYFTKSPKFQHIITITVQKYYVTFGYAVLPKAKINVFLPDG
jgi:hypothetical protein